MGARRINSQFNASSRPPRYWRSGKRRLACYRSAFLHYRKKNDAIRRLANHWFDIL
jgi:hypothetical protein